MNYAVEVTLDGTIYISNFVKIGSGVQKLFLDGVKYTYRHRQQIDLISLLLFSAFKIWEVGYKGMSTPQTLV
jgi:hypothetical protein